HRQVARRDRVLTRARVLVHEFAVPVHAARDVASAHVLGTHIRAENVGLTADVNTGAPGALLSLLLSDVESFTDVGEVHRCAFAGFGFPPQAAGAVRSAFGGVVCRGPCGARIGRGIVAGVAAGGDG